MLWWRRKSEPPKHRKTSYRESALSDEDRQTLRHIASTLHTCADRLTQICRQGSK